MFTQEFFRKHKLTPEDLKAKFTKVQTTVGVPSTDGESQQRAVSGVSNDAKTSRKSKYDDSVVNLIARISDRIKSGVAKNIRDHKLYLAIDKAYDVGFQQVAPTLVESLLDGQADEKKVLSAFNEWGLGYMIKQAPCTCNAAPCTCNCKEKKILNIPAFFKILVPLVKAYVTIRWAKIYTDRNITPLYKIEPARSTALNRLRADILTDRIQMMATQFGYNTLMRQEIFQALLYAVAYSFPKESWYTESVEVVTGEISTKKIVKEGLRYNTPHPSRVFVDPSDRPSTFNTDTGCSYAGYWRIAPWKEVRDVSDYWNVDVVQYGENWTARSPSYFEEIFHCSLTFPTCDSSCQTTAVKGSIAQRDESLDSYYTTADDDKAVVVTEYFEKLNPSDCGLGDYDGNVWFRFVVASNDTVVYCEPLPYCPAIYTGYDADENREKNASLALEVMPFQDHIGNLLSQYILSVKQNLDKIIFYNTDVVDEKHVEQLENIGEKRFRAPVYIPFSGKEQISFAQTGPQNAFLPVNFPHQNTQEIAQSITAIINILERILALSAQELGQTATHEQTAQESIIIANNVSTRLGLTASFVDDASQARKIQLYNALMAYGTEEVYAQIDTEGRIDATALEKIGFTVVPDELPDTSNGILSEDGQAIVVKGSKKGLTLDSFASNREGENRVHGPQLATSLANFVSAFSNSSSALFEILGPDQTVKLFNQMAAISGFPRDFRLQVSKELRMKMQQAQQEGQQPSNTIFEQVAQAIRESQASTLEEVGKAIVPLRTAFESLQSSDQDQTKAIQDIVSKLNAIAELAPQPPQL